MTRTRPCRICRRWFAPNPRAGARQRVCSRPACQRERHRRSCASWHARHPDYDGVTRLQVRLAEDRPAGADRDLLAWTSARAAVGLEVLVVLEEFRQLLVSLVRAAVTRQLHATTRDSRQVLTPPRETLSTPPARPP